MKTLNLIIIILIGNAALSFSQPGVLDNTFGISGMAFGPFVSGINHANAIALQPDGKVVITGYVEGGGGYKIFVVRYNPAGSFDTTFGSSGNVITNISSVNYGNAIAVQSDGKIVVAGDFSGFSGSDFVLIRYMPNGDLDSTFGSSGIVAADFDAGSGDATTCMAIQPDGKIVVAGWTFTNDKDIAVLRFLSDGNPDSTFGTNGKTSTDINNQAQEANALALQPNGKIVVTGFTFNASNGNDVAVFRYNENGILDSTFGNNGIILPGINNEDDEGNAIAIQPDGKIVIAGFTYSNTSFIENLVMRFDSNGVADTSFNTTGMVVSDINGFDNLSTGVLIQSDGKIVTTGRAYGTTEDFSMSRFNNDGSLDTSFGNSGHVLTDIASDLDESNASVIQQDGKILLTGFYTDAGLEKLVVCRYVNDSTLLDVPLVNVMSKAIIFPQPATNTLNIKLHDSSKSIHDVKIFSSTGMLVTRIINFTQQSSINISNLSPGLYFIQGFDKNENQLLKDKFIKN